MKLGEILKSC